MASARQLHGWRSLGRLALIVGSLALAGACGNNGNGGDPDGAVNGADASGLPDAEGLVHEPLPVTEWMGATFNPNNPDQSEEAAKAFELVEPGSELVTLVDVTPVNRTRNFHNFSLETPEFFDDLFLRLVNTNMPKSRPEYPVQTPDGRIYWILTRGR